MAKTRGDFTDVLLRKRILSAEQFEEARHLHRKNSIKLEEAIVSLQYATSTEVTSAMAEAQGVPYIDLTQVTIPPSIIELVPESLARERVVLPYAQENGALKVIMSDPSDLDALQAL